MQSWTRLWLTWEDRKRNRRATIEYVQRAGGSVEPRKAHTFAIITEHAETMRVHGGKDVTGYSNPEETVPSMMAMSWQIEVKFIKETLEEIIIKNGKPTLNLHEDHKRLNFKQLMKHIMEGLREAESRAQYG